MPIAVTCGGCGKRLKVPDSAAGKRGKCPQCGATVPIPEAEIEPLPLKAAEPVAVQRVAAAPVAVMAPPVQNVQAVAVRVEAPRRGSGLGLAACILGVLAFVICWVPLIGLIGVPLSALGLILGLIGLLVAILRKGAGIGFAIAGSAI